MVQHAIPPKTPNRRAAAGSPSRTKTQRALERGMGHRRGSRMVFENGGFAAPARSLAALPDWNHDACDHASRAVAEAGGVKAGLLINAIRVAIVGQAVAPPLFDTMVVLGQERVVRRLRAALKEFATA